jgi:hypothetical protein
MVLYGLLSTYTPNERKCNMGTLGNILSNNAEVMLFFSFIIVAVATVVSIVTSRLTKPERYLYRLSSELDSMQEKFLASSRYHLEVAATLEYLDQIQESPALMDRLGQTSREVLTASLLQRMSLLAGTLAVMHTELEKAESSYAYSSTPFRATHVSNIRGEITQLQADQQALHQLCELLGGVPSVTT